MLSFILVLRITRSPKCIENTNITFNSDILHCDVSEPDLFDLHVFLPAQKTLEKLKDLRAPDGKDIVINFTFIYSNEVKKPNKSNYSLINNEYVYNCLTPIASGISLYNSNNKTFLDYNIMALIKYQRVVSFWTSLL